MIFSGIIGHKEIIRALGISLTEARVGHAYLFLGPVGVGKKSLAQKFATALLCPEQGDCSEECPSCRRIRQGVHPDFITVTPNGNSIKIEQLREFQRNAFLRPLMGVRKVFFFPEAEQLTEAAANSFLKLLEEPPPGVTFLFAAVRADNILPTIRSRCQIYNLFPVAVEEITAWLMEQGFTEAEAFRRGLASRGLPGVALLETENLDQQEPVQFAEVINPDLLKQFKLVNDLEKKDRREVLAILQDWEAQVRANILHLTQSTAGTATDQMFKLVFIAERLARVIDMVESNVNFRLAIEEFFLAVKVHDNFS